MPWAPTRPRSPKWGGAVAAASSSDAEVILVGDEKELKMALSPYRNTGKISIVHASEVITMQDSPVMGVRQKKDSSLLVAVRLLKEGKADGIVSAGNTGAVMVAARTILGPIRGVARSAICQMLPTVKNPVLVLDLGANVDCSARHLCEFAEMGVAYSKYVLDVDSPRVGLLNIGEESAKGNELTKTVHRNLSATDQINFIGNIEPKAMYKGEADVVVCDGFIGNVVLKTSEAMVGFIGTLVKRELLATLLSRIGALLSRGAFNRVRRITDSNEFPGAMLLGVNGTVIILHGSCTGHGVANAVRGACRAVEHDVNEHIRKGIQELRAAEAHLEEAEE